MKLKYRFLTELFEAANKIEDPDERANLLRLNMRESVKKALACFHNPEIEFYRPSGLQFNTSKNRMGLSDTSLDVEMKRIYIFQKNQPLDPARKEARLLQLLEGMAFEEASFLYNHILAKKNPYKNLQRPFVKRYFPEVLDYKIDRR